MAKENRWQRKRLYKGWLLALICWISFTVFPAEALSAQDEEEGRYESLLSGERPVDRRAYAKPKQPTVYLTFDDGPSRTTPGVLDVLKKEGIRATFFVIGEQAENNPQLVRRIVEEGHSLGNHSYNHQYKSLYEKFDHFWGQIQKTEEILAEIAGVRPLLVRAPGGTHRNFDAFYFYYMDQAGYVVNDWNVDSGDSRRRNVPFDEILGNVRKSTLRDELIVLMHDGAGNAETLKALPDIISYYKAKGYTFAPLTPEVKPVMFSLGSSKWKRNNDEENHLRLLSMVMGGEGKTDIQDAGTEGKERVRLSDPEKLLRELDEEKEAQLAYQGSIAALESSEALLAHSKTLKKIGTDSASLPLEMNSTPPPLTIVLGSAKLELSAYQYELRTGTFYVPLRQLVESSGGQVYWDEENRVAAVRYGVQLFEYHVRERSIVIGSPHAISSTSYLVDMEVKNGTLMVPIRTAVALMKSKIADYTVNSSKREVQVALRSSKFLAYTPVDSVNTAALAAGRDSFDPAVSL